MPCNPISILFTHYGEQWIRGSERLLLDLLTHLDRRRVEPIVWCNGAPMAAACQAHGFTTYHTEFSYYFDSGSPRFDSQNYWSFVRQGIRLVREHKITILHSNSAAPSQFLAPVARATRTPLLTHLHIDYFRRSRFVFLMHQASLLVGVSQHTLDGLRGDGVTPKRLKVIYNGIDFSRFDKAGEGDLRRTLGIADSATVVSAIGSLIPRKGYDVLIKALQTLGTAREIHLIIAGEGSERTALEQLAAGLGIRARIHFLGHLDNPSPVYRATDIVALASRGDSFGLVLAEAGYFALPAVATRVGGIPEVIEHERTGLLVPPDDPPALAAALSRLMDDPIYRRQLGIAAKERVKRLFSVERMVADFHETYEDLAQLPRRRLGWLGMIVDLNPYLHLLLPRTRRGAEE